VRRLNSAVGDTLSGSEGRAFGGNLRAPAPSSDPSAEWSVEGTVQAIAQSKHSAVRPRRIAPVTRPNWATLDTRSSVENGEEPPSPWQTLQPAIATILEVDAGSDDEVGHRARDEHLACQCVS